MIGDPGSFSAMRDGGSRGSGTINMGGDAGMDYIINLEKRDPSFREFLAKRRLRAPGMTLGRKELQKAYDDYTFERRLKQDIESARERSYRESRYAMYGLDYQPQTSRITSISSTPSQRTSQMRAEKAAIKSKKESEAQQLADAKWLSQYDARRAELEKRATSSGVSAQDNYDAQQELNRLELEKQQRETRVAMATPIGVQQLQMKKQEKEQTSSVVKGINDWISANPDKKTAIAQLNKLMKQAQMPGSNAESIAKQAESIVFFEEQKAQRDFEQKQKLQESAQQGRMSVLEATEAAKKERDALYREWKSAENEASRQSRSEQANAILFQKAKDNMRRVDAQIAVLVAKLKSIGVSVDSNGKITSTPSTIGERLSSDIQNAEIELAGYFELKKFYQDEYDALSSSVGSQPASPAGGIQSDYGDATGYPDGTKARSGNTIIVVRNGRWVAE